MMTLYFARIVEAVTILIWIGSWFLGGYLIVINLFKVRRQEATILGFSVGLIIQVWVANWVGHVVEPLLAFWSSAILIFVIGVLLTFVRKDHKAALKNFCFPLSYWLTFVIIAIVFFMIGRGLAIFDDYQNLPMTSFIASGSIPPRFVLNPEVSFDYHYLMLLNAAQWMRVADLFPWTALDINRAIFLGLSIILVAIFGYRITRNKLAGWLTAIFFGFSGGMRWLLVFIPAPWLEKISSHITMIGSGQVTSDSLAIALTKNWAIEGVGPVDFPFAFGNGFYTIPVFKHDGTGMMGAVIAILILLLFDRWKDFYGKLTVSILLSAMALIDEIWFVFFITALVIYFVLTHLKRKKIPDSDQWLEVIILVILPVIFAITQGGVLTGIARGLISTVSGKAAIGAAQYFTIGFPLRWPPAIISAHLGVLSLTNWAQWIVAFCEVGPILLIYPLLLIFGFKGSRSNQKIYGILAIAVTLSILMVFVEYQGSAGISASKRLVLFGTDLLILFTVPLLWFWLKNKRLQVKMLVVALAGMTMMGGMIYFMISSIAIQKPVLSYFIKLMDASVENVYWDELDENAMVFDYNPSRSATIFARPLESNQTWYVFTPEYKQALRYPDPYLLNKAGYTHIYLSRDDFTYLTSSTKILFEKPCVDMIYNKEDWQGDFRWLLDITACQN